MKALSEDRGVLFVDISDSTRLYNELGNDGARQVVVRALDLLAAIVEHHKGTVVDRIGDELMCTLPTALATATAAVELQRAIRDATFRNDLPSYLSVRIGFHFGSILRQEGRIFGDTVYTARRMASLAKAHQILTTGETVQIAKTMDQAVRFVDRTRIKGRRQSLDVYEIIWDPEHATVTGSQGSVTSAERKPPELSVWYNGDELRLDPARPRVTIGRDVLCDIQVEDPRVSRLHARIEFRKTCFYLTDASTNGTFVIESEGGPPIRLRRRAHRLHGEGLILLSRPGEKAELSLKYRTDPSGDFPYRDTFSQEIG